MKHDLGGGGGVRGVVALRFLPNLDLVITMLALAKAGLAYLPLAPEWPQGRLQLLIDEVKYANWSKISK